MSAKPNVAVVEVDQTDGVTITLLGYVPDGLNRREFRGKGLREIDTMLLDDGIQIVGWLLDAVNMPFTTECDDLPLIERARK